MVGPVNRVVDVLVVGAGPAGLAAAARLAATGGGRYRIEVLEREPEAGGVPRHCAHGGFGLADLRRPLDGPGYARRLVRAAHGAGASVRTGVSATGWAGPLTLDVTAPTGLERITARAVVLATGARERPRSARLVPGTRPAGVLTTGELQQSVDTYGVRRERLGRRAVLIGAEPVAHHAARVLRRAQVDVVAMVTEQPRGPRRFGDPAPPPLLAGATVTELLGRGRLAGIRVRHADGRSSTIRCDTVVFTGDWIPDHELARAGGVPLDAGTRGPAVDGSFRTASAGIFAAGNVLRGIESAGAAAAEGRGAADAVLRYLSGEHWPVSAVPLTAEEPVAWVAPNRVADAADARSFLLRVREPLTRPLVEVSQDGRLLHRGRLLGTAWPHRSVRLSGGWAREVDPAGGPVEVRATV
ncbi:NAD(P)/FAD-dependent oxidoreductase [Streptomyces sp. Je 1-79]|uniref:NAD(P)/FAD-dependent oxidoreductase n=1 Tax=Streptomyces sp. Je 1-79 TaxID=2943847 RepID=UPI0021A654F9|nr:NAD(P)/FAD-dependent oxidoreductase [Streptomyces sp. Je 1-79]MCT4357009.1 NAD(P)/FAD-dependent oxidoreductase [Streptomyces sp. Je 1-79]